MIEDSIELRAALLALDKAIAECDRMRPVFDAAVKTVIYALETWDSHRCTDVIHPPGKCVDCELLRTALELDEMAEFRGTEK